MTLMLTGVSLPYESAVRVFVVSNSFLIFFLIFLAFLILIVIAVNAVSGATRAIYNASHRFVRRVELTALGDLSGRSGSTAGATTLGGLRKTRTGSITSGRPDPKIGLAKVFKTSFFVCFRVRAHVHAVKHG